MSRKIVASLIVSLLGIALLYYVLTSKLVYHEIAFGDSRYFEPIPKTGFYAKYYPYNVKLRDSLTDGYWVVRDSNDAILIKGMMANGKRKGEWQVNSASGFTLNYIKYHGNNVKYTVFGPENKTIKHGMFQANAYHCDSIDVWITNTGNTISSSHYYNKGRYEKRSKWYVDGTPRLLEYFDHNQGEQIHVARYWHNNGRIKKEGRYPKTWDFPNDTINLNHRWPIRMHTYWVEDDLGFSNGSGAEIFWYEWHENAQIISDWKVEDSSRIINIRYNGFGDTISTLTTSFDKLNPLR